MDLLLIKQHLYVNHTNDDALIEVYADAAETAISNYLHKDYEETNKVHEQAKLLLIGNFYANRESVITGTMVSELPFGIKFLLDSAMDVVI